jgi:radical SAM protein with 4Fe4S-binding SPASM domain
VVTVATERDLHKKIGNFDVYKEFEMLEVKVPSIFLGAAGFCQSCDATPLCLPGCKYCNELTNLHITIKAKTNQALTKQYNIFHFVNKYNILNFCLF